MGARTRRRDMRGRKGVRRATLVLESMIPKKPAPYLIRGGNRLSEKIMLQDNV
jgi:hypothetical protein